MLLENILKETVGLLDQARIGKSTLGSWNQIRCVRIQRPTKIINFFHTEPFEQESLQIRSCNLIILHNV